MSGAADHLTAASIAEGVETENQRKILQELDCDIGQGYLFSAAMPESEALCWKVL
ncbi:EAL domain-containing protein [Shewanella indica]|uniref:EAL domain-containing protein n=1 Tax=Shewanella indica TaxID=768528 RepID=UPI002A32DD26|nr:EAL domain-containing protein [Vibrio metschnikovii]